MNSIEKFKDVAINERNFRITKFEARKGSFAILKIVKLLAPLLGSINFEKMKDIKDVSEVDVSNFKQIAEVFNFNRIAEALGQISEEDFMYLQDNCLKVCSEMLPAGPAPVLNKDGSFGVIGLETDTVTVMALTVHALIFNVKSFFSGSPLASLAAGVLTTFPRV